MLHWLLQQSGRLLSRGKLSILIYHQVLAEFDPMRPTEPTAAVFDWQMQLLARYFTPLSLDQALQHLADDSLPPNAVCVTFDDGYLNNLTVAAPILARYQIPATVYIATAFSAGSNMWNDRIIDLCGDTKLTSLQFNAEHFTLSDWPSRISVADKLLKKLKYLPIEQRLAEVEVLYQQNNASDYQPRMMNASQIKQLADTGITIGAHTLQHPILKSIPPAEQQQQIEQSKAWLEQLLAKPVLHFAYPNGVEGRDFDDTTVNLVQQAGFLSAVVTDWGYNTASSPRLKLKRFTPWDQQPVKFQLRLLKNLLS